MANYTTTRFKATETIGDSIFNKNMITEASINILPDKGYVVTASDFSMSSLPNGISAVTFTDTKTAGQPGNEVKVVATFANTFVVAKRNKIVLDFIGEAKKWDEETSTTVNTNIVLIDDKNINKNGSVTVTAQTNYTVDTVNNVGTDGNFDIINNTVTGNVVRGTSTKIATVVITADTGYYFTKKPVMKFYNGFNYNNIKSLSNLRLKLSSSSRNANKRVTSYTFNLFYRNSYNVDAINPLSFSLEYNAILEPVSVKEVISIECSGDSISERGDTKNILVDGNDGAEFDLTITKKTDPTVSILNNPSSLLNPNAPDTGLGTVDVNTPFGVVKGINKKITSRGRKKSNISYCAIIQEFPAYNEVIRTTALDMGSGLSGTTAIFDSIADVKVGDRLFMDAIPTNTIVKVAQVLTSTRCELDTTVQAADDAVAVFRRQESYDINIYPKAGTTLGSRIPIQIPHKTINQYKDPVLKLTATTANAKITAPADVSVTGRANTSASKLRESLTATAASGTSVISYYKAGKDRGRRDFFRLTYTVASTHAVTINNQPVFSNLLLLNADGTTASNWTNCVTADNGGTQILIGNIVSGVVSSPSHVYTLAFDVLIKKFGSEDTTMVLNLDNLISA